MAALCALAAVTAACGHSARTATPSTTTLHQPPATTATTAPPTTAPPSTIPPCTQAAVIASWSLARRAAQVIMAPADEANVPAAAPMVNEGVGGLFLFGTSAPATLPASLAQLRAAAGPVPPLVAADEEGGGIQPMANLDGALPWPRTMAATMTTAQVRLAAQRLGERLRAIGVTMDLAPVLDLSDGPGPSMRYPDGARSFSVQPAVASSYGLAFADGLLAAGVVPVVKHFPGLGQASANTDFGPANLPALPTLEAAALAPFEAAVSARLPAVMVSHAVVPGLTAGLPVSLSSAAITGLLRNQLGFGGLVITDALSADAITAAGYSVPAAAVLAVEAGADMVLFKSNTPQATTDQVIASIDAAVTSGQLPEARLDQAVERVLAVKGVNLCP